MSVPFRCDCPITSALDILGDRWILVIVKQMLLEDATTFKDFVESPESIATNILTTKLKILEETGIIRKERLPENRKSSLYVLTERGLSLASVIAELASWSDRHLRELNPAIVLNDSTHLLRNSKEEFVLQLQRNYKDKLSRLGIALE